MHAVRLEPIVPGWGEVLTDVAWRVRPIDAALTKAFNAWELDEDAGLYRKARRPTK